MKKVNIKYFDAVLWKWREYVFIIENSEQIQEFITKYRIEERRSENKEIDIKITDIELPYLVEDRVDYGY